MYLKATALCLIGLSFLLTTHETRPFKVGNVEVTKEGAAMGVGATGLAIYFGIANLNRDAIGTVRGLGFTQEEAKGLTVILTVLFVLQALGFHNITWPVWLLGIVTVSKLLQGGVDPVRRLGRRIEYGHLPLAMAVILMGVFAIWQQGAVVFNHKTLSDFIGMFLATFGTLKAINFEHFIAPFVQYDLIASFFSLYAYLYPIIELAVGSAILSNAYVDVATTVTAGLAGLGIVDALVTLLKGKVVIPNHLISFRVAPPLQVTETILMAIASWAKLLPLFRKIGF